MQHAAVRAYQRDEGITSRLEGCRRVLRAVVDSGYRGWIGIEYEGKARPEPEGIRLTKALLERVREKLTPEYS